MFVSYSILPGRTMRHILKAALLGLPLLATPALAQTSLQTAAVGNLAPAAEPSTASTASTASPAMGGIAREQYLQHARERAEQRAAAQFDQMDANHDGILERAEIRTWRSQHPRGAAVQPAQPAPQ